MFDFLRSENDTLAINGGSHVQFFLLLVRGQREGYRLPSNCAYVVARMNCRAFCGLTFLSVWILRSKV